jgi:prolipoprotein diacylglyceryltransferase
MFGTFTIYFGLSIVCNFLFGYQILAKGSNVILNINQEYEIDNARWEAFLLRVLFMIVLGCHVPFIFFSGKEAMLIIIDEIDRRSISSTLDVRVLAL